ncbi:hypothetical protein ARMSODRAFT_1006842 [Armillaria solidipes]|uniref:Extracellular metalloproteinase n=1 Tax=Armillaria solidipes TaxID=1076256 RepID=A0A2H3B286_9AGAR|nr:hypothetical protein ARMSODRAFT_1006842 [Armillaria solidipes]
MFEFKADDLRSSSFSELQQPRAHTVPYKPIKQVKVWYERKRRKNIQDSKNETSLKTPHHYKSQGATMPSHNSQKPGATNPRVNSEKRSYGVFRESRAGSDRTLPISGIIASAGGVQSNIASFTTNIALDSSLIREAEDALLGIYSKISLEYLATSCASVGLTLVVQVKDNHITRGTKQSLMPVDAHSDEILSVTDRAAQPTYIVARITKDVVTEGQETFIDPKDLLLFPSGWGANTQIVPSQSATTSQSSTATFDFDDTVLVPIGGSNFEATRTTAFYITNEVHDYAYKYGWTTVYSGQPGTCMMYISTLMTPNRHGALQNDSIIHGFTHGITNCLTGGETGQYLQATEAGGMGEGHGFTYIGEVWANILHSVYAALVEAHGVSETAMDDPSGTEGNIVWLHIFIDAASREPCNPTLPNARGAWIQTDQNRYDGANACTMWNAFANRGLGVNAANYVDNTGVPSGC